MFVVDIIFFYIKTKLLPSNHMSNSHIILIQY